MVNHICIAAVNRKWWNKSGDDDERKVGDAANVDVSFEKDIAVQSPFDAPRIASDPVICPVGCRTVTNQRNPVIDRATATSVVVKDSIAVKNEFGIGHDRHCDGSSLHERLFYHRLTRCQSPI